MSNMWSDKVYWHVADALRGAIRKIEFFKVDSAGKRRLLHGCHHSNLKIAVQMKKEVCPVLLTNTYCGEEIIK